MAMFLELTADDASGSKILINSEHIVGITPNSFEGTTKIMVPGVMFVVREEYDAVKNMMTHH